MSHLLPGVGCGWPPGCWHPVHGIGPRRQSSRVFRTSCHHCVTPANKLYHAPDVCSKTPTQLSRSSSRRLLGVSFISGASALDVSCSRAARSIFERERRTLIRSRFCQFLSEFDVISRRAASQDRLLGLGLALLSGSQVGRTASRASRLGSLEALEQVEAFGIAV